MNILKSILAGMGLAAVGYGAYKGVQYLIENNSSPDGDEISAAIEKARTRAGAGYADPDQAGLPDAESDGVVNAAAV